MGTESFKPFCVAMGKRIRARREQIGMTQDELAARMGFRGKASISRIESGENEVKTSMIPALADILETDVAHLMGWTVPEERFPGLIEADGIISVPRMYTVPLIGTIACGKPILAEENLEGDVSVPEHIHADFALRCKGDSMINARIFDGDIVYIRSQAVVDSGEIAAVVIREIDGDDATLKRVRIFDDHIILEPANPMYQPLSFWGEDMNNVRIIGRAVGFTSVIV